MTLPDKKVAIAIIESYINSRADKWGIVGKDAKDFQIDKDKKFKYKIEICGQLLLQIEKANSESDWEQINKFITEKIQLEKPLVAKGFIKKGLSSFSAAMNDWILPTSLSLPESPELLLNLLQALNDYVAAEDKSTVLEEYFKTFIKKWDNARVTQLNEEHWYDFQEDVKKGKRVCNVDLLNIAKEAARLLSSSNSPVELAKPAIDDKTSTFATPTITLPEAMEKPAIVVTKPIEIPVKRSYADAIKKGESESPYLASVSFLRPSPVQAPKQMARALDDEEFPKLTRDVFLKSKPIPTLKETVDDIDVSAAPNKPSAATPLRSHSIMTAAYKKDGNRKVRGRTSKREHLMSLHR